MCPYGERGLLDEDNTETILVTVSGTDVDNPLDLTGEEPVTLTSDTRITLSPTDEIEDEFFIMDMSITVDGATSVTVTVVYENGTEESVEVS